MLPTEQIPRWAAFWLADGYDGEALIELAGLHGDDPHEVRDLLGTRPLSFVDVALCVVLSTLGYAAIRLDRVVHPGKRPVTVTVSGGGRTRIRRSIASARLVDHS